MNNSEIATEVLAKILQSLNQMNDTKFYKLNNANQINYKGIKWKY